MVDQTTVKTYHGYTTNNDYVTCMADSTIEAISNLLKSELEPISSKLDGLTEAVNSHTNTLDAIAKNTTNWQIEAAVMKDKLNRYERAIKLLAQKTNVDVEGILHP
jgi:hypothetical protein